MSFWRTAYQNGRWWLLNPANELTFSFGLNTVEPGDNWRDFYASKDAWREAAGGVMARAKLNTTGAFSKEILPGFARTWHLNLLGGYTAKKGLPPKSPQQLKLVTEPGFKTFVAEQCADECEPDAEELVGYFLDNELNWNSSLADFRNLVETYFQVCRNAIRARDANHLIMGSRFHRPTFGKSLVWKTAGLYCDVISVNYYGVDKPVLSQTRDWFGWTGKPYLVTEMYAMADQGVKDDMPCDNSNGAGKVVPRQSDRADFYDEFMTQAYRDPYWVGTHWFRYMDDPSSGGANKGIVGVKYSTYGRLIDQMTATNGRAPGAVA